jgi:coenzyme F420-0:L-glutamate ligase/coenzyme F420-1:gamma-L-glutamate ligase
MQLFAIPNLPLVQPGDDLARLIVGGLASAGETLQPGDILVIAQKIISKAEGRLVRINDVVPSEEAVRIAATVEKDPRVVQVILDDSRSILRMRRNLFIVEQSGGWICANAGVDRSNIQANGEQDEVLALLPADADASAERLRQALYEQTGVLPAVIINDSHGRPWRVGTVGVTIGCAGLPPIWDQRGLTDLFGYELKTSQECIADELAAAASLLMGQSREGRPVVVIRGYQLPDASPAPARTIQRAAETDAFRGSDYHRLP